MFHVSATKRQQHCKEHIAKYYVTFSCVCVLIGSNVTYHGEDGIRAGLRATPLHATPNQAAALVSGSPAQLRLIIKTS